MAKAIFAALALVILAIAGVQLFQAGLATAGDKQEISDESFTPTAGSLTTLDRSDLDNAYYSDTVNVQDENGSQSFNGTDYIWFQDNGTIKPLTGGNLDGDASATIDYSYRKTTAEQRGFAQMLSTVPQMLSYVVIALFAVAFVGLVRGF